MKRYSFTTLITFYLSPIKRHVCLVPICLASRVPPKQREADAQNVGSLPGCIHRLGSVDVLEQVDGK